MENSTEELLRKVLIRLDRIEEKQDKHQRSQADLSQEIQSVKAVVLSHGEKVHSLLQQLSTCTSAKSLEQRGQAEGHEISATSDPSSEAMTEMKRLFREERQFLRDDVQEAQNDILNKLTELHQGGQTMLDLQDRLRDQVKDMEDKLNSLSSELKEDIEKTTALVKAHVVDVNPSKSVDDKTSLPTPGVPETNSAHGASSTSDLTCQCTQTVVREAQETTKQLTRKLTSTKLEIFRFIEKECQLVKDALQSGVGAPVRKKYICDFFVDDFKSLIKSGEDVYSYPWYIDQLKTSVQGKVRFWSSGDMKVWLLHGRHPREVGLEPRSEEDLKVFAAVTDLSGTVANHTVGEVTVRMNENDILDNNDWGAHIGTVSCQTLLDLGFATKEKNYVRGAILVRYEIEIL